MVLIWACVCMGWYVFMQGWWRKKCTWERPQSWQNVCQMACKFQWVLMHNVPNIFATFFHHLHTACVWASVFVVRRHCVAPFCCYARCFGIRYYDKHWSTALKNRIQCYGVWSIYRVCTHKQVHVAIIVPLLKPITATKCSKISCIMASKRVFILIDGILVAVHCVVFGKRATSSI